MWCGVEGMMLMGLFGTILYFEFEIRGFRCRDSGFRSAKRSFSVQGVEGGVSRVETSRTDRSTQGRESERASKRAREGERERERETGRESEREREREGQRDRERKTEIEKERERIVYIAAPRHRHPNS